ncbi:NAD(P)-dependent oxidoreductase [Clostridium baratii]
MGASNHSELEREKNDFYATEPKAIELLLELEEFNKNIWECACGEGHLSKVLSDSGYEVLSTDLIDRGYGKGNIDFLKCNKRFNGDIITNPPYKYAKEFILKALELVGEGDKVAMFLKVQFLEGKARKELFKNNPPKKVYVSSSRLNCAKNGEFEKYPSSAIAYAWFVWEKGYKGKTIVEWFN